MPEVARKKAEGLLISLAEPLPFEDESFDTAVSSLSLCTFPDPVRALRQMARVCRADGRILLLDHGRSDRERLPSSPGGKTLARRTSAATGTARHYNWWRRLAWRSRLRGAASSASFTG
jgi:ubiquinone/menaquinone biosynthesis C-methylase UbiE